MKTTIIIEKPHSFVDLITNSSTELFIVNTDKEMKVVEELLNEVQSKYPNDYGYRIYVNKVEEDDLMNIFDYYYEKDKCIEYLTMLGYKIISPDDNTNNYIKLSIERGYLNDNTKKFIEETFNIVYYSSEA